LIGIATSECRLMPPKEFLHLGSRVAVDQVFSVRIQTTSCPEARSAVTASPGKFSSARNRIVRRSRMCG
jgi:RNase P protein component